MSDREILQNIKKGDTVSIKLEKSGKAKFSDVNWFSKFTKLYGLAKDGKEYLPLECRNSVSNKRTHAATVASIVSAILSLIFAVFVLKPKTKYQALGQFPIDPILIVIVTWVGIYLMLR